MKLLIVNGSPRPGSSTEILAERFEQGFRASLPDVEVVNVILNDLDIIPCQSCGFSPAPEPCIFKDDLYRYLIHLREADFVLVVSPVYFDSVSSLTKLFIDRTNCFRPPIFDGDSMSFDKSFMLNSKGGYILVGGEREKFDAAERVIGGMFVWCGIEKIAKLLYAHSHARLGAVAKDEDVLQQAYDLGVQAARAATRSS
jgi:multimeric flavodoxin WrbA